MFKSRAGLALALTLGTLPALAQGVATTPNQNAPATGLSHGGMTMPGTAPTTGSSQAFREANDQMMQAMSMNLTGDTDRDFVAGMIPHHQGAVAMAKIELQYGKDPQIRALAQRIIADQQKEIATMQAWQNAHKPKP